MPKKKEKSVNSLVAPLVLSGCFYSQKYVTLIGVVSLFRYNQWYS